MVPDWEHQTVLHTLLNAPFGNQDTFVSYSDTIFRKEVITELLDGDGDFAFAVDTAWEHRYQARSQDDIDIAEKIDLSRFERGLVRIAEFTGLMAFKPAVVAYLNGLDAGDVGVNLMDLAFHLKDKGFRPRVIDVKGHWAELNAQEDIARFVLGTKADTLARLEPVLTKSTIGKQLSFTTEQWNKNQSAVLADIRAMFAGRALVVRSSSVAEDGWVKSSAGQFESCLNVDGADENAVGSAIETVVASYEDTPSPRDQVLVQPYIRDIEYAGVVFSRGLDTGAPYYRLNFNDEVMGTNGITSGAAGDNRTIFVSRFDITALDRVEPRLLPVLDAVVELEEFLGFDKLDVEFALTKSGYVCIFQVRPITVDHSDYEIDDQVLAAALSTSARSFRQRQTTQPFVYGDETLYSNMSDWNPAEIIGAKPKPLAFSLYRHIITNEIWARQRAAFGYRDVNPHPLIVAFCGQPYVDLRASLNSFIPARLPDELAQKLASAYVQIVKRKPQLHDKIEFEVASTVWTPSFAREARERLSSFGISELEIDQLGAALKELTRNALTRLNDDILSIEEMNRRYESITKSSSSPIDQIVMLIEDCRNLGTLAFAHAARAGFVATSLLKSFVAQGILQQDRYEAFMQSVMTVSQQFIKDRCDVEQNRLGAPDLLQRYGHLRPGTYEITAPAYWENPDKYLAGSIREAPHMATDFAFSRAENDALEGVLGEMGGGISVFALSEYLCKAIQLRETVKFEFTRNLSRALDLCVQLGEILGIARSDLSFTDYDDLLQFKLNLIDVETMTSRIQERKQAHLVAQMIELPSVLSSASDFYCFERGEFEPNFVTTKSVIADIHVLSSGQTDDLRGQIVVISQADPGYDWLIGRGIAGLITKYGGANSHMAIRAAEAGLPAAIGVGEKHFERISRMKKLHLDCANRTLREVQ